MSRRLPIYFLLDVSGSMYGEPITAVETGLQTLISALRNDPQAVESAWLSVITFSNNAEQIVPLTELSQFNAPPLSAFGMTELGEALAFVKKCADNDVKPNTAETKGDWKPLVFIMTDGIPTDDYRRGLAEFRKRKWGMVVACAAGQDIDTNILEEIAPECVVQLSTADSQSIAKFFRWVSASIATSSKSVGTNQGEVSSLSQLPPPPPEITIV